MSEDQDILFGQSRAPRNKTNWIGLIRTPDGTEVPCTVKDVSKTGAKIGVPANIELPDEFMLKIVGMDYVCSVNLAWRAGSLAGLRIVQFAKLPPQTPDSAAANRGRGSDALSIAGNPAGAASWLKPRARRRALMPSASSGSRTIRLHPGQGHAMPVNEGFEAEMLAVVRSHHEMLDGSGYPDGLNEAEIPDLVRLITVCDIYAALIERRAYKPPMPSAQAYAILTDMGGRLDPVLVRAFEPIARAFTD